MEDVDLKREIGQRIRQKRGKIKQKDFAKLIGLHKDQLSRYETGKTMPREQIYSRIMEFSEDESVRQISEPQVYYQNQTIEQKKLLDNVVEILESGNDTMIEALKGNIKAFLEAVRMAKNQNEDKGGG